MTIQRPRRAASRASLRASASDSSAPVGLPGELSTIARVRGVTAARNRSAVSANPSSACVRTITGVASASLICSTSVGQPGRVRDDLVARPEQRQRGVKQRLLAAGGDDHFVGRYVTP